MTTHELYGNTVSMKNRVFLFEPANLNDHVFLKLAEACESCVLSVVADSEISQFRPTRTLSDQRWAIDPAVYSGHSE
jgi:hypothetical protein